MRGKGTRSRLRGQSGFTLVELLVVIIIIAILSAIAIPTYLGQRGKAQDAAAKSLVRNAMSAVESAYTDTQDFATINLAALQAVEPAIAWAVVATTCSGATTAPTAQAKSNAVNYFGGTTVSNTYELGTVSASTKTFGVKVVKAAGGGTTYYKGTTGATTW